MAELAHELGVGVDAEAFADAWRARYQPSLDQVRTGRREWTILDVLHRESLDELLPQFGLAGLDEGRRDHLARAWHRLDPWPDVVAGLERLKALAITATLSNGNVALLVNMAKRAGLAWDVILSAETSCAYKPLPQAYLKAVEMLGIEPVEAMMIAAHGSDLEAASAVGLRTAFVHRPDEHGRGRPTPVAEGGWEIVAADFVDLADRLAGWG